MKKKIISIFLIILTFLSLNTCFNNKKYINNTFNSKITPRENLIRSNKLSLTSNALVESQATSGDGTEQDPYIIENLLIECNNTGIGILITNTNVWVIFRNIFINESGKTATDGSFIINNCDNVKLDNITMEHSGVAGLAIVLSNNVNVTNCYIYNATYNLYLDSTDNTIVENTILNYSTTNLFISSNLYGSNSKNLTINNCTLINSSSVLNMYNLENAIFNECNFSFITKTLIYNSINISINNSNFQNFSGEIIIINNCNIANITYNNFTTITTYPCIDLSTGTTIEKNIDISFNKMENFITTIYGDYLNDSIIHNNTIIGNDLSQIGIWLSNQIDNLDITNNYIKNMKYHGLKIIGTSSPHDENLTISNNYLYNTTKIQATGYCNIELQYIDNALIFNNTIEGSNQISIILDDLINATIDSNTIRNCTELDMITLELGASNITISNNYLYSPKKTGYGDCDAGIWNEGNNNINIINNTFHSFNDTTNGYGYLGTAGNNILIQGNNFTNCRESISITTGSNIDIIENIFEEPTSKHIGNAPAGSNITNNYWYDYFDIYPYDLTGLELLYLPNIYNQTGISINDSNPFYLGELYQRNELLTIKLRKLSNWDYIIDLNDFTKSYLNSIRIGNLTYPNQVLYRLYIEDYYFGLNISDNVYNLNTTGTELNIQLAFSTLAMKNKFTHSVRVFIERNAIVKSFTIESDDRHDLDIPNGDYIIWVEDLNGNELLDLNTITISKDYSFLIKPEDEDTGDEDMEDQDTENEIMNYTRDWLRKPEIIIAILSLPAILIAITILNKNPKILKKRW